MIPPFSVSNDRRVSTCWCSFKRREYRIILLKKLYSWLNFTTMKKLAVSIFSMVLLCIYAPGQELCVGDYWTEARGKAHLDSVLKQVTNKAQWETRAKAIRRQILAGSGLSGLPEKRSVPTVKTGKVHELDGYRVTNMAIESSPGSWITGNLYEPIGQTGPFAAILCPHGHWSDPADYGRYRPDMQKRCAVLSRMGAVVFAYDMVGYGDNTQVTQHKEPLAFQIQTRNSIRVVDYMVSRPDIDPRRIAATGASGGGTQTFILAAIDERIAVSVPCVMVSAHFFGGCVCESGMPIHKNGSFQTNNVEIAALAAPRPMLLISDGDDWTKNTPVVEYPFIKKLYKLYGQENRVEYVHFPDGKHDYGFDKRQAAYAFLARYLGLNADKRLTGEEWVKILESGELKLKL